MNFEMDLELLMDGSDNLRGFSIKPKGHTESETFCHTFLQALCRQRETGTDVVVRDGRLHFVHPTFRYKGECSFPINPDIVQELSDFLELQGKFAGKNFSIKQLRFSLTGGFEILTC